MAKNPESSKPQKRWRENIEALAVAVVVALLFKYFILEISKIPSGSMQPTLIGHPQSGVFDRVLVDKLSFRFRDPDRFEIVVFKHPLERSRVMVKRLVGMPGEELKIENGDLWTRASGTEEWKILRPPASVQDELWRRLDVDKPKQTSWSGLDGDAWLAKGRGARTKQPGRIAFRRRDNGIRDEYTDGYPDALRREITAPRGRNFVGDLRVEGEVHPAANVTAFVVELKEGTRSYVFRIPGPAADAGDRAEIRYRAPEGDSHPAEKVEFSDTARLAKSKGYTFAAQNLNDRLTLTLDGETLAELDIPANKNQHSTVQIGFEGGGGELDDLQVLRDTYYASLQDAWSVEIPEGNYVMLGDNTLDSADSRLWEEQTIHMQGGSERRGNYRHRENPLPGAGEYGDQVRFKDTWGEVEWFPRNRVKSEAAIRFEGLLSELGPIRREPLVPRSLIQGRAVAVFWPLQPTRRLWRLAWLH